MTETLVQCKKCEYFYEQSKIIEGLCFKCFKWFNDLKIQNLKSILNDNNLPESEKKTKLLNELDKTFGK